MSVSRIHSLVDDDYDEKAIRKKRRKVGPGYRFQLHNDELIDYYLKNKVQGIDLHDIHHAIAEVDILDYEPHDLPRLAAIQSKDPFWYFFYRLENYGRRTRGGDDGGNNRTLKNGLGKWKVTGTFHPLRSENTNQLIGTKRTLVYCPLTAGLSPEAEATVNKLNKGNIKGKPSEWTIHEFHLPSAFPNPNKYIIVMLNKKGGKPLDLSPAKAQVTNFPHNVTNTCDASFAIDSADHVLATTEYNDKRVSSCVPFVSMIPEQRTLLQEFLMNDSYTDGSIDPIPLIQAELDQNFDFISEGSEDDATFKRLCDELCIKSSDLQSVVGNTPSPQSPNFFESNMLLSQGCVTLLKSPQLNHNI
ncbi:hypothetical protein ACFE04_018620 [Oxalis oulophora]